MTVRLFLARTAAPILAAFPIPPASTACSVPQPRLVCAEYANSTAIVVGTLRATRHLAFDSIDADGHLYNLEVKTLIRGDIGSTFQIWEENSSGRASFDWKVGTDYLLFLLRYSRRPTSGWVIDGYGNSGPMSESGTVLESIKVAQANTSDGLVYGRVSADSLDTGVPDVIVRVLGKNQAFSAHTDQSGRFLLRLPAGKYALGALRNGWSFGLEPLSYEDPRNLSVVPGYCAQIQFSGTEKNGPESLHNEPGP